MQKTTINNASRNPFAHGKDEKLVWKELVQNAKPLKKEDFLRKISETHKKSAL